MTDNPFFPWCQFVLIDMQFIEILLGCEYVSYVNLLTSFLLFHPMIYCYNESSSLYLFFQIFTLLSLLSFLVLVIIFIFFLLIFQHFYLIYYYQDLSVDTFPKILSSILLLSNDSSVTSSDIL